MVISTFAGALRFLSRFNNQFLNHILVLLLTLATQGDDYPIVDR